MEMPQVVGAEGLALPVPQVGLGGHTGTMGETMSLGEVVVGEVVLGQQEETVSDLVAPQVMVATGPTTHLRWEPVMATTESSVVGVEVEQQTLAVLPVREVLAVEEMVGKTQGLLREITLQPTLVGAVAELEQMTLVVMAVRVLS